MDREDWLMGLRMILTLGLGTSIGALAGDWLWGFTPALALVWIAQMVDD